MKISRTLLLVATVIWSNASLAAGYVGNYTPTLIFSGTSNVLPGANWVYFGTITQPSDTCNYWGRYYKFDGSTAGGKNLLAVLLTAKASGKNVDLWYAGSLQAGTNQSNGCGEGDVSTVTNIGISD